MEKIIVSYIKSPSEWGEILFRQVKDLFEDFALRRADDGIRYKIEIKDIVNEVMSDGKSQELAACQEASLRACVYSDVVIFDGSIEDDNCNQYQFAYDLMKHLDYVLFVSRTELPYNFEGCIKGGAPSWIKIGEKPLVSETVNDRAQLNAGILKWLGQTLNRLELPRSNKQTSQLSLTNIVTETMRLIQRTDERMKCMESTALFISYLSRDFETLKECFGYIEHQTGFSKDSFHYFAPGKVAKEFMSEERRWEIVSVTDREMDKCGAILIFETDGYYRSWWTMGERMSVSYRFRKKWEECPTVYVVTVCSDGVNHRKLTWRVLNTPQQKRDFFPVLSEYQTRQLARRFANSDPDEAAYELDEKTIKESKMPFIAKIPRAIVKGMAVSLLEKTDFFGPSEEKNTLAENIMQSWESENSYTHTKEFRTKRIVECKYCREAASDLTVDDFIRLDMPYVYHVDDEELIQGEDGTLILPQKCPVHGNIRLKKNGYYYRFIQPRRGKVMGAGKTIVEKIDRIDFDEE